MGLRPEASRVRPGSSMPVAVVKGCTASLILVVIAAIVGGRPHASYATELPVRTGLRMGRNWRGACQGYRILREPWAPGPLEPAGARFDPSISTHVFGAIATFPPAALTTPVITGAPFDAD